MTWNTAVQDRIWFCDYSFGPALSNCLAFKTRAGLVVVSPSCEMTDAGFEELASHGDVVALVAPNGFHHLGLESWRTRFPNARAFAAEKAAARIHKKNPGAGTLEPLAGVDEFLDEDSWMGVPEGFKTPDTMARIRLSDDQWFWYTNDCVGNNPELPKNFLFKMAFKMTDSGPGFKVNRLLVGLFAKDKKQYQSWFAQALADQPPVYVLPGHGNAVEDAATAGQLRDMVLAAW